MLPAPVPDGTRAILERIIGEFEALDNRLRQVERVTGTIQTLADLKGG